MVKTDRYVIIIFLCSLLLGTVLVIDYLFDTTWTVEEQGNVIAGMSFSPEETQTFSDGTSLSIEEQIKLLESMNPPDTYWDYAIGIFFGLLGGVLLIVYAMR